MQLMVQGLSAHAYTGGKPFDPALPCIVFVHGALNDHSVWTLLARWFAHHGHSVLALDLPGHGQSGGAPLASIEALADWALTLLDSAGVQQAALVGHSMGSLIALEAAAQAPQRITRLVMVGCAYPMKVSQALLTTAREAPLKAIDMVNAFSIASMASKPSYPGPGMWLHGANRALMRRTLRGPAQRSADLSGGASSNLFHHDFSLCDRYANGLAAAAQVQCPVSFILGSQDQMTSPKVTHEIAAALKATVHTLACGHCLMQEQPDAMLDALRRSIA